MSSLNRNIILMKWYMFLHGLMFFLPVLALLYESKLDSVQLVASIMAIQSIFIIIFEIPSGAFSDRFGRKTTIIIAGLCTFIALPFLYFGTSFAVLVMYAMFNALGRSFISGTDSSLIYESNPKDFKKTFGSYRSLWPLGAGLASLLSNFLFTINYNLPVAVTMIPFFVGFILTFFLVEPKKHVVKESVFGHMKKARQNILSSPPLLILVCVAFLFFAAGESLHQMNSLFFSDKGISLEFFGIISMLVFGFSFLGFRWSHSVSSWLGDKKTLILTAIAAPLVIILATQVSPLFAGLVWSFQSLFWGIRMPIMSHLFHTLAHKDHRATILSISNFANQLGFALSVLAFGYLAKMFSLNFTIILISLLYIPAIFLLLTHKLQ